MASSSQYQNDTALFEYDDFFSLPVDFISQNEYNQHSTVYDDLIEEDISSLPEVNNSKILFNIFT